MTATPKTLSFIASYPRSGNTWVRSFLFFALRTIGAIPRDVDIRTLSKTLPWDIAPAVVEAATGRATSTIAVEQFAALRPRVHEWLATRFAGIPIVKTHTLFGTVLGHPTFVAHLLGPVVYLVRNPLDVAPSLARLVGLPIDQAIKMLNRPAMAMAADREKAPELWGSWAQNVSSWTEHGPRSVLTVRFEDLVAEPTVWLARITAHLGISISPADLRSSAQEASLDNLRTRELEGSFPTGAPLADQFFGGGVSRSYRDKLTGAQARAIIEENRDLMSRFNYLDGSALAFAGLDGPNGGIAG